MTEAGSRFWCRMSDSPPFYPSSRSQAPAPQASLHPGEPRGTSCQQMAESQAKDSGGVCFAQPESDGLRPAAVSRRHSADGAVASGPAVARGPAPSDRFHPYRRQISGGAAAAAAGRLRLSSASFSGLQQLCSPDTRSHSWSDAPTSWEPSDTGDQVSRLTGSYQAVEPPCFLPQSYASHSSSSALQQGSSTLYHHNDDQSSSLSTQSHQQSSTHPPFPKPIYSYSILIFMALKNSKAGSLPVSEIYSFMTEQFPYFKTAPDGWKNSVRHNLSLNKCFVKVQNKNGNSSRKGCLWALNPAKVEKMQEELHKWRRKDPVSVRRSMARPEDLDRLTGEKPNKLRSLLPYSHQALLSRVMPPYTTTSSSCTPAQIQPPCLAVRRPQYANTHSQQPCYPPPATTHPSNSYGLYSACGQPAPTGSLNSPMAAQMPPVYNAALQQEHGVAPRSMQDLLLEGDASYDIDMLNPSLTDLQLQGNLWEELREDSLVSDPQVTTTTPSTAAALPDPHVQVGGPRVTPPPTGEASEVTAACRRKPELEDENTAQHCCLYGRLPVGYSGLEGLAGYLTSCCSTSISSI